MINTELILKERLLRPLEEMQEEMEEVKNDAIKILEEIKKAKKIYKNYSLTLQQQNQMSNQIIKEIMELYTGKFY